MERGGTFLVTADHGNCDEMIGPQGEALTAHSLNPVPFVAVSRALRGRTGAITGDGHALQDIAPTVLKLLGIAQPSEMTGHSLL